MRSLFEDLTIGRQYLILLRKDVALYESEPSVPEDVLTHIREYINFVQEEALSRNRYLNDPNEWYPYSVRSSDSIKGKRAEFCYVVLANMMEGETTFHFYPDPTDKRAERQGKDCICKNPRWRREFYPVQVKYTDINKDRTVLFRPRFFKYLPHNVFRLILADPDQRIAVEMDYHIIARMLDLDMGVERNDEEGKVERFMPYERLSRKEGALHLKWYNYRELSLSI